MFETPFTSVSENAFFSKYPLDDSIYSTVPVPLNVEKDILDLLVRVELMTENSTTANYEELYNWMGRTFPNTAKLYIRLVCSTITLHVRVDLYSILPIYQFDLLRSDSVKDKLFYSCFCNVLPRNTVIVLAYTRNLL